MYIISGCNGSGKTTASYTVLAEQLNLDEYVNADEIAESLSPQNPSKEIIRATRLMMGRVDELIARSEDFAVETTLATRSFAKVIVDAQQSGYTVTILFFWLSSPELAVERVAKRAASGGHNVPEETIRRRYYVGIDNMKKIYIPLCDFWVITDNSKMEFKKIASGGRSVPTKIYSKAIFRKILEQA